MKRVGNIHNAICSMENLQIAVKKARKGKGQRSEIKLFDKNAEINLRTLQTSLLNGTYKTSPYSTFRIYEPKERVVSRLPFYPDRIVHHALMSILEPVFTNMLIKDTYSSIKGRGIHAAADAVGEALKNPTETRYCLKLDIQKFYPSIDHKILKGLLRRKIKDNAVLAILDEIIDSTDGLPIGSYLSQFLANFYLTGFDHWLKQDKKVKYYFRYADDIVILAPSKEILHQLLFEIRSYLAPKLNLKVKENYQVFPVSSRGIDFVGYVFYHSHRRLRKRIKKGFARMLKERKNPASIASYNGWIKHCCGKNLIKKLLPENLKRAQIIHNK